MSKLEEIRDRHATESGPLLDMHGHRDIAWLIAEVDRLRRAYVAATGEEPPEADGGCPYDPDGVHDFRTGPTCEDCGYTRGPDE